MNGHNLPYATDLRGAHILEGPKDSRYERVKLVPIDASFLINLLKMDGTFGLKMEGLPDGAEVLSIMYNPGPPHQQIMLVLHKADWPVVLVSPEMIPLKYTLMHWTPEGMSEKKPETTEGKEESA